MRYTKLFIPTLREVPSDAEAISHKLLLKAGYIRQLAAGLYIFLPLSWRVLNRINRILIEEMESINAQEITMPILHPAEIWQTTGRWYEIKDEMFRLKDRNGRDMCLGMTHEEIMAWLASKEIRSYRELPQIWYQIQTKLRDEARPKSGILRTREFIMKDSYSFDADEEGLEISYKRHAEAYHRIFKRCGLKFYQVQSDPGMMGGAYAHEFMAPSPAGEDEIVICDSCGYTANIEIARSLPPFINFPEWDVTEEIYTPNKKTINELSDFLKVPPSLFIKALCILSEEGLVLVLVRGDQELHEKKLTKIIGPFRPATKEEIIDHFKVEAGYIGPINYSGRIISDFSLKGGIFITGANKKDYHLRGVKPDLHFKTEWHDIHLAKEGDFCHKCKGPIRIERAIEIGNIFKLGTKYSAPLNAVFLDKNGNEKPLIMGSYGIGPARIAAAVVEQNHDEDGIIWNKAIAPFDIHILPLNMADTRTVEIAESLYKNLSEIYNTLTDKHMDVLIDDRNVRPGVKFKDADLIGIPLQVIIGERSLKEDYIEVKIRRTKELIKVPLFRSEAAIVKIYYETE
ncbi:MAG: proline--tRNA ligase [Thermodesulfovibrionales bacterium]|nr:proline--tRNA ligase [Thermodesulfovibrionales bacterium]